LNFFIRIKKLCASLLYRRSFDGGGNQGSLIKITGNGREKAWFFN